MKKVFNVFPMMMADTGAEGGSALAMLPTEATGKMKRSKMHNSSIRALLKKKQNIRPDLAIQRNYVWNPEKTERASMLIHSIIDNFPTGTIYIQSTPDKFLWLLDGKQRMTTIFSFINDEWALHLNTPDVTIEVEKDGATVLETYDELGGKRFSELPKEIQEEILDYDMDVVEVKNITVEQRDEMFQRLNNGMPLTKAELTNAIAGTPTLAFIREVLATKFFGEMVNIAPSYRLRHVDVEMVEQIMLLMMRKVPTAIDPDTIRNFIKELKEVGVKDEFKETIFKTTEYLTEAFLATVTEGEGENAKTIRILDDKNVTFILKKVHTPMIFLRAIDAIERGIEPVKFAKWVLFFFKGDKERQIKGYKSGEGAYGKHCSNGSAKVDKVKGRIEAMTSHFNKYFKIEEEMNKAHQEASAGKEE
jgi:hypothetical protein